MTDTAKREETDVFITPFGAIVRHQWQVSFQEFCPEDAWVPAINLYRLQHSLELCIDLAGVDPRTLRIRVLPGRLTIQGFRAAPEPQRSPDDNLHIQTMEIDHGPFSRTVQLPERINIERTKTRYHSGLLWITLMLKET
jgi:HSP20 family molecular chaperone IbpA